LNVIEIDYVVPTYADVLICVELSFTRENVNILIWHRLTVYVFDLTNV